MISEEEKKAIEYDLKCLHNVMNNFEDELCETMQEKVAEIKEFIEKQQAEYSHLKLKYEQCLLLHKKHVQDLEIKDKMIDEAMDLIVRKVGSRTEICHNMNCDKTIEKECKNCALEYFRKKVENE